jgi:DNA repair protein RadC
MKIELLEEILSYVSKNPTKKAEEICEKYGTYLGIAESTEEALSDSLGGNVQIAFYLKLCAAISSRRKSDGFAFGKRHTESEIKEYLSALLFGMPEETVYMLSLDSAGRCVGADRVGEGIVNFSSVLPRKVVDAARRRGARSVIIAHNHPGARLSPSVNDISATESLTEFLRSAEITLEKSYIVSGMECVEVIV